MDPEAARRLYEAIKSDYDACRQAIAALRSKQVQLGRRLIRLAAYIEPFPTTGISNRRNSMSAEWTLEGKYFETCNCDAACPCIMLSDPTEEDCTVLVGWHIDAGVFGDVTLDGLNVALAVYSPGNMAEVPWQAAVYFDDSATDEQTDALTQIFGGHAGGHPARLAGHIEEILGVASVPIEFHAENGRHSLRVGDVGEATIAAFTGQGDATVTVENHPLAIAPGHPATVARSESMRYQDHGFDWELSERNGLFSPFSYRGP